MVETVSRKSFFLLPFNGAKTEYSRKILTFLPLNSQNAVFDALSIPSTVDAYRAEALSFRGFPGHAVIATKDLIKSDRYLVFLCLAAPCEDRDSFSFKSVTVRTILPFSIKTVVTLKITG